MHMIQETLAPIRPGWLYRLTAMDQVPMPDNTARRALPWMMQKTLNQRTMARDRRHVGQAETV